MSWRGHDHALGRTGRRLAQISVAAVAVSALLGPVSAQGSVTVGSPLTGPFFSTVTCANASGCTWANTALGETSANLTSPISGVVVRWRMTGSYSGTFKIRVLRPVGDSGEFTGLGTGTPVTATGTTTQAFGSSVPIEAGDLIGIDYGNGHHLSDASVTGSTIVQWAPALADGSTGPPSPFADNKELYFNADVEPDCDNDGLGDETQDSDLSSCGPGTGPGPGPGPGPGTGQGTAPAPTLPSGAPATCRGVPATIVGTDGSDERTGSQSQDVIVALGGNDTLSGLGGNDVICGGPGKDTLRGGGGKDTLLGQKGKDALKGGGGKDLCKGGKGRDTASKCEVERSI
jgi:hypothetical protein